MSMRFDLHNLYNFQTYAPGLFDAAFRRMKVVEITTFQKAMKIDNVLLRHRQIFPMLPEGTPNTPTEYTYIVFQAENKKEIVLAYPWIIENTIVQVVRRNLAVKIYGVDDTFLGPVRDFMNSLGVPFTIDIEDDTIL